MMPTGSPSTSATGSLETELLEAGSLGSRSGDIAARPGPLDPHPINLFALTVGVFLVVAGFLAMLAQIEVIDPEPGVVIAIGVGLIAGCCAAGVIGMLARARMAKPKAF